MKRFSFCWMLFLLMGLPVVGQGQSRPSVGIASEHSFAGSDWHKGSPCLSDPMFLSGLREIQTIGPNDPRIEGPNLLLQNWFPSPKRSCEVEAQVQFILAFETVANHALECFLPNTKVPVNRCRLLLQLAVMFIDYLPRQSFENRSKAMSTLNQTFSNVSAKADEVKIKLSKGARRRAKISERGAEIEFARLFSSLQALHESWGTAIDKRIEIQLPYIEIPLPAEQVINLVYVASAIREKNHEVASRKLSEVLSFIQAQAQTQPSTNPPQINVDGAPYFSIPTQPLPLHQLANLADTYMNVEERNWDAAQKKLGQVLTWLKQNSPKPPAPKPASPPSQPRPPLYPPQPQPYYPPGYYQAPTYPTQNDPTQGQPYPKPSYPETPPSARVDYPQ